MKSKFEKHGFLLTRSTEIPDIKATLFEGEHIKSGARLLFLDREDENKTFSIAFKTIPEDNTGVFHIIEHSVLCGSEKYPVKEPFVELLKGSLNTFLNAMTFPDKTMYPFSSRNDKDFSNLLSVYMDAVLHPRILKDENIFRQEGWHYVLNGKNEKMSYSGVVLNEMRGAYSSPETVSYYNLSKMLYSDTPYRFESGGEPTEIQDLTYEMFVGAHKRFYHPSNAEIFLDGSVRLDEVLCQIDGFLKDYERAPVNIEIPDQPVFEEKRAEIEYEISDSESPENKTRMSKGFITARFDEQERTVAIAILADALLSSNESPVKKALIESGLCEDVSIFPVDSIKENGTIIDFINVKDGKCDELSSLFVDTVKGIAENGIQKDTLLASLNSLEFKMREKDYGRFPIGLVYAMSALETSLYGGDPTQNLSYEKTFASLREKIESDYFEKLLLSVFITNPRCATLIMTPSAKLGEEKLKNENERLARAKASFSDEELSDIIEMNRRLLSWQETPDSEEALATLPMLKLSDISSEVEEIDEKADSVNGVTVLSHDLSTNGISYIDLYFDVTDLSKEEIFTLRMLTALAQNVKTEKHTALELQNIIKRELGAFDISMTALCRDKKPKIYAVASVSALDSNKASVVELLKEVLYTSIYTDKEIAHNVVRQMKLSSDEAFTTSGNGLGFNRAASYISPIAAVQEYFSGYEAHKSIKSLERDFDSLYPLLSEKISELSKKIFTRNRLLISHTGTPDGEFISQIIDAVPDGEEFISEAKIAPLGLRREGIAIAAQASYAELVGNLFNEGEEISGSLNVLRSLVSYGYLWGAIRVQGGAYGTGLIVRNTGNIGFYSYRDPSPERSIQCYKETGNFLREFAKSGEDITKFIIGAIGEVSPLANSKLKGTLATSRYLRGKTVEDERRVRAEMLATDGNELMRLADVIDKISASGAVCIVAGKDKLESCSEIDTILEI